MSNILFESERLYFREPNESDTEILYREARKVWPELRQWMSWTAMEEYTLKDAREFTVDFTQDQHAKGGKWMFGFDKETNDFVVSTGLAVFEEGRIYETGYWIAIDYLGKGYATEATQAVLKYAADKITLSYYEGNTASRRVIEKCGFDFVETLPKHHKCHANGELLDEHCYAMTKDRWRERQHRP